VGFQHTVDQPRERVEIARMAQRIDVVEKSDCGHELPALSMAAYPCAPCLGVHRLRLLDHEMP
jgi:hypothetical protein